MAAKLLTAIGALLAVIGMVALLVFPAGPVNAQSNADRYLVTPIEGGIMRVDRFTGEVSTCTKTRGKWSCALVPDDRRALEREIDQLEDQNARLNRRRGGSRSAGQDREHDRREAERRRKQQAYDDLEEPGGFMTPEEVDNAMTAVDRMMKRFMETARRIRRQMSEGDTQ